MYDDAQFTDFTVSNEVASSVFIYQREMYSYPINISVLDEEYFSLCEPFSRSANIN